MASSQPDFRRRASFWSTWGAVIILGALFLTSWGGQFASQLIAERNDAQQHNQQFHMSEFIPQFLSSTFENWQSEWLQLGTQSLLLAGFSSYVFRKQNEEHYKTQIMIDDLRKELSKKH